MAKSTDNDKVESPSRDRNTDLQDTGISDSGHVATVHNTQLPPPVHVSDSGASSTSSRCTVTTLAGTVDVSPFSLLNKVI